MGLKKNLDTIIKEKMMEAIINGSWKPGMQISLEEIMGKYDVSRTPVIQALKEYVALGVVIRTAKGHYYCEDYNDGQINDIIDVRLMLEKEAIRRIADKDGCDLAPLMEEADQALACSKGGDIIMTRRRDMEFHKKLVELAGSECLSDIYYRVQIKFMMVNYMLGTHSALQQEIACQEHIKLVKAIMGGDSACAQKILSEHINGVHYKIRKHGADTRLEA